MTWPWTTEIEYPRWTCLGTETLMISWKFHTDTSKTVATVASQLFEKVGSRPDLVTDLRWTGNNIFRKCGKRCPKRDAKNGGAAWRPFCYHLRTGGALNNPSSGWELRPGSDSAYRERNVEQTLTKRKVCENETAQKSWQHKRSTNECQIGAVWMITTCFFFAHFSADIAISGECVSTFAKRFVYVTLNLNRA